MTKKEGLLLGAQVSITGGIENSIKQGVKLGCTAIQIFTKNNRQWSFDALTTEEARAFIEAQEASSIKIVVSHASYLINLGSPKKEVQKRSLKALEAELMRCHQAKIPLVVLHPGSCLGSEEQVCATQIADHLSEVLERTPKDVAIVLENMAGQGSVIGSTLEQLAEIYRAATHKGRLGFCFDTCHGFAAGYDLRTEKRYHDFWDQFDKILGIDRLKVMHLNDSKKGFGTHVDRHEDIGKGEIGIEPFRFIMQDTRFKGIPKIIETPMSLDTPLEALAKWGTRDVRISSHGRNLAVLRRLAK